MGLKITHANEIDKIVGANLRAIRIASGLSQTELAEAVDLSFQQIQKYEHGNNRIGASRLWQFCEVFKIRPQRFFENLENEHAGKNIKFLDGRLQFLVHPKGQAMAEAFLLLKDPKAERAVIHLCKALSSASE